MAMNKGYVFEHRLVMSELVGRTLLPSEVVHHVDEDPANNAPENLWVFPSHAAHSYWHSMLKNGHGLRRAMAAVPLAGLEALAA
jgi:hypothetical protein